MIKKIIFILNFGFIIFLNILIFIYIKLHYIYYNKPVYEYDLFENDAVVNISLISILLFVTTIPFIFIGNKVKIIRYIKFILYMIYLCLMFSFIYIYFPEKYLN
ncbi:hypothetical protein AY606_15460 [Acinetobacter sp. SFB]|nr:hypothetical protein AY606_15460 [Acinetobacter sp. SFB]